MHVVSSALPLAGVFAHSHVFSNENLMQCDVRGDLLAVPQGSDIICWSAQEDEPQGKLRRSLRFGMY